jgi:hypothetical protein
MSENNNENNSIIDINDGDSNETEIQKIEEALSGNIKKVSIVDKNEIENSKVLQKKVPRRQQLINNIKKQAKLLGVKIDNREIDRSKLSALEEKLANLTTKTVEKIEDIQSERKKEEIKEEIKNQISDETATNALFNYNIILARSLEEVSKSLQSNQTVGKYTPNLTGYTQKLFEQENELKEALKGIVLEHGTALKPYLSPLIHYMSIMLTTASQVMIVNGSKNLISTLPEQQSTTQ